MGSTQQRGYSAKRPVQAARPRLEPRAPCCTGGCWAERRAFSQGGCQVALPCKALSPREEWPFPRTSSPPAQEAGTQRLLTPGIF